MNPHFRSRRLFAALTLAAATGLMLSAGARNAAADGSLNVLTWCDHEDPALLQPFEQANGVKVNFKDISSTAQILAVLGQSKPGDWDVVVMDATDTGRLAKMGILAPLN
ncbi:MAG TPA: extracellular solute-binding protein, partial [Dongiaceae bacterium]|nr:extracellular solute-binding protein [Dongiaceae bacterium]